MPEKGPDYISWTDWHAKDEARRAKIRRAITYAIATGIAVIAAITLVPPTLNTLRARAVAAMFSDLSEYEATVSADVLAHDNLGSFYRQETVAPPGPALSLWDGNVLESSARGRVEVFEPQGSVLRIHTGWSGQSRIASQLERVFTRASSWKLGAPTFNTIAADDHGLVGAVATEPLTRTTVWMDPQRKIPVKCAVESRDYRGWSPYESITFGPPTTAQAIPENQAKQVADMSSPQTWKDLDRAQVASFPLGDSSRTVKQIDVNSEGTIFILLDRIQPSVKVAATIDGKPIDYMPRVEELRAHKHIGRGMILVLTRLIADSHPIKGPVHLVFQEPQPDSIGIGELDVNVSTPTCFLVPYYKFDELGDEAVYYRYLADSAGTRAQFYANPGNYTRSTRFFTNLGTVKAENREKAIELLEKRIFYERQMTDVTPYLEQAIASDWMSIYDLLKSLGRDDEARNALFVADHSLTREAAFSDVGRRITRAQQADVVSSQPQ